MAQQRKNRTNAGLAWRRAALRGLALLLLTPVWPASAEIYKCRTADGRTEISSAPCPTERGTLSMRPDETVPAETHEQAERDVQRMRDFVDQRASEQRQEAAAEQQRQAEENQAEATRRVYAAENMETCLAELGQLTLPTNRRAELEAICRAKAAAPVVVGVPVYGGIASPVDDCIARVMRLRLAPAEQQRRIAQCRGVASPPPPLRQPAPPSAKSPAKPKPPATSNQLPAKSPKRQ